MKPRLVSIAVPVPYLDPLIYNVPEHLELPPIGARVRVPMGTRTVTGCVVQHGGELSADTAAKDVLEAIDREPLLPASIVELCRWVAEYYMAGIGDALRVAMPPSARRTASGFKTQRIVTVTTHGLSVIGVRLKPDTTGDRVASVVSGLSRTDKPTNDDPSVASGFSRTGERDGVASVASGLSRTGEPDGVASVVSGLSRTDKPTDDDVSVVSGFSRTGQPLGAKQLAALEALAAAPAGVPTSELRERGIDAAVVGRLAARGLVTIRRDVTERDPMEGTLVEPVAVPPRELTREQRIALDRLSILVDAGEFRVALLHGVTGSGKTEIYLRLAEHVARSGRQVLLMVPEIALTPSVATLFHGTFGPRLAIQHSGLSDGERHDQWQRIRRGDIDIVVGTRSAVFAPLTRVGLIVVDEEHDTSYKQEEVPRYHGRDVAIMRGSRDASLVVLGSATPSMESFQNALTGKYERLTLEIRILERPLADVRLVNMREEYAAEGPDVVMSRQLTEGVRDRLLKREQVLILLNRRGYATAVLCRECGDTFECPNCSISLTVHAARGQTASGSGAGDRRRWRAHCHYCNYSIVVPTACRRCAGPYLQHTGFGTEKVEQQLRESFPEARIGRVDRDSVRRRGTLASILSRFAAGELDVLVGTQMIAKGHDFPRVTLVGVISADVGLGLADFRAGERTFQLLTQVAGRAGRGDRKGEAIVQTLFPDHYSIRLACRQQYTAFFERELTYRRAMRYPPLVALINAVVRGRTFHQAMDTASDLARRLEAPAASAGLLVLGPAPAPLGKLRGEHRVQLLMKGTRRADMRALLTATLAEMPEIRKRVTVDVDPLSVL